IRLSQSRAERITSVVTAIVVARELDAHRTTGEAPARRAGRPAKFLPKMPESLEKLDLLLLTVRKPGRCGPMAFCLWGGATLAQPWPPVRAMICWSAATSATLRRSVCFYDRPRD